MPATDDRGRSKFAASFGRKGMEKPTRFRCENLVSEFRVVSIFPNPLGRKHVGLYCQMKNQKADGDRNEDQREISEISKRLAEKYAQVLSEPVPKRLADLIRRLKEVESR